MLHLRDGVRRFPHLPSSRPSSGGRKMWSDFVFLWGFLVVLLGAQAESKTDAPDVSALNVMFTSLRSPSQLSGWKSSGGDPCADSWEGIKCSDSSVTEISLSDYGLGGSIGYQLSSLTSVTYFDLSKNNLEGDIPYQLPPNAIHIDLSENSFTGSVPYSVSQMADLEFLNLGHNQLTNQLSDMFGKLSKLKKLDLSHNSLSGNLPQSFKKLSSLASLYLEDNHLSGTINVLASLSLDTLNIENNKFTGWIPDEVEKINNLDTGGNSWSSGPAPPPPPGGQDHAIDGSDRKDAGKSVLSALVITGVALGILMILVVGIAVFSRRSSSPSIHFLDEEAERRSSTHTTSQELSSIFRPEIPKAMKELKSFNSSASIDAKALQKSPSIGNRGSTSDCRSSFSGDFANCLNARRSISASAPSYSLADLQTATANFATGRLLREGSIGRVYRAKFADGKVTAVKQMESSLFQGLQEEEFSEIVANMEKIHHPNIAELLGYCSEQGHCILVFDYFRNGSLHEYLHMSDDFSKPLTWNTRVRIALGIARAIEYLHDVCSPSLIHKNIKSSNILLDTELNPHLSACGLATLYERASKNLEVGYRAHECNEPSAFTLKSDVYSFGVVMLELLTGRMPLDSSKAKSEQCLVLWASPQLHDVEALAKMVDPALCGLYPPESVSRFADIIALCVQSETESRPLMSEVVQALFRLVQRSSITMRDDLRASFSSDG